MQKTVLHMEATRQCLFGPTSPGSPLFPLAPVHFLAESAYVPNRSY